MFEPAELHHKISKEEYQEREPRLREALLEAQREIIAANTRVIVLFGGVDGAGKSETANLLTAWMDPRGMVTRSFGAESDEEAERPPFWRYWLALPGRKEIGIFLSAWYSRPLLDRAFGRSTEAEFDDSLEHIRSFESMLSEDGALIVKFWMHLSKRAQRKRFKKLEANPLQKWRVTKKDWANWQRYEHFIMASEHIIARTSTGDAPWRIIDGSDYRYRSLKVGGLLLRAMRRHLAYLAQAEANNHTPPTPEVARLTESVADVPIPSLVLDTLNMDQSVDKPTYKRKLVKYQGRLNLLQRVARERGITTILVFEGWDAGGKGGAIRRLTSALEATDSRVIAIAAPTDEESRHHYLWRFWRHLPRAGKVLVFDRSWYGRVLVERIEGFATQREWRRAYAEINDFERALTDHGIVLLKFWMHITKEEQANRFELREQTPHKRWKLTEEDKRNREKWEDYEVAVNDMIERTSTRAAPWILVEGNDKRYARLKVISSVCNHLEAVLEQPASGEQLIRKK